MKDLWTKKNEIDFFNDARKFVSKEQLFYFGEDSRYYAYWPKSYKGKKATLQSRNSLIGNFTEKFCVDLLQNIARSRNYYAIQGGICNEIGLSSQSPGDVVFSRKNNEREQNVEDITAIFEVKMSIVWNWELKKNRLICLGDFKSHRGTPGLLRSDSMLKAIGKSINVRVSNSSASRIPIIILGNTPIAQTYISKVDYLFKSGIIQGFWSLNPNPLDNDCDTLKQTPCNGFIRMDSYNELAQNLYELLSKRFEFFSSMKSKTELGKIIEMANKEQDYESKAETFLKLIRG